MFSVSTTCKSMIGYKLKCCCNSSSIWDSVTQAKHIHVILNDIQVIWKYGSSIPQNFLLRRHFVTIFRNIIISFYLHVHVHRPSILQYLSLNAIYFLLINMPLETIHHTNKKKLIDGYRISLRGEGGFWYTCTCSIGCELHVKNLVTIPSFDHNHVHLCLV